MSFTLPGMQGLSERMWANLELDLKVLGLSDAMMAELLRHQPAEGVLPRRLQRLEPKAEEKSASVDGAAAAFALGLNPTRTFA